MTRAAERRRAPDGEGGALAQLWAARDLITNLTLREVRGKYKRTVLGQAWSLLNPVAQMLIYALVFGFFLRFSPAPGDPSGLDIFVLWLASALIPWLFFANLLTTGMTSIIDNANLVKKVYFPRQALVVSNMFAWLSTVAIEMSVLTVAVLLFGGSPLLYIPATAFFICVLGLFGLGLGLVLSVAIVYFRDTQHFIGLFMQMWFYLTPVVYPLQQLKKPAEHRPWLITVYRLNPLERFTEIFRNTLYDGRWPTLMNSLYVVLAAAVSVTVGLWVFKRYEGRMAEEL